MNHTRTHKTVRSLLVWLLMLTMVFSLLPMAAFADDAGEPVVSEEPVQEPEPSSEPTEAPSETTQEPEPEQPGNAVVTIEGDEEQPEDELDTAALVDYSGYQYSIVMVDCGRKYFNVDSINAIIDSASAAGMHYVMLAVGNDGLRFLLNDMSLTVNSKTYDSKSVSDAIHAANKAYDQSKSYNPYTLGDTSYEDVEELTENDMNAIMRHANDKGVQIIPLINTPGHMDSILSAATALTGTNCSYNGSVRTIDVNNATAVGFTQALLQKYIDYFAGKGCKFFNMGADEYANDTGNPSFNTGMYGSFITYINTVAGQINAAGMTPMAFNDGIYYANREGYGTIDTSILVCYWSKGWSGYNPAEVNYLINKGFKVINTNGDYYWIVGGNKCTADKAATFKPEVFNGCTATNENANSIAGAMFCIWSDEPNAMQCNAVSNDTANVINSFGSVLPETLAGSQHYNLTETTPGGGETGGGESGGGSTGGETQEPVPVNLTVGEISKEYYQDGDYSSIRNTDNDTIATVATSVGDKPGTGTTTYERAQKGVGTFYVSTSVNPVDLPESQTITIEEINGKTYIKNSNNKYIYPYLNWWNNNLSLEEGKNAVNINSSSTEGAYTIDYSYRVISTYKAYLTAGDGKLGASENAVPLYLYTKKTSPAEKQTTITFTGVKPGNTTCKIGDTLYKIIIDYKQETVNAVVGGTKTVEGVSGKLDTNGLDTGVATVTLAGNVLTITGVSEGNTSVIVGDTKYTITVTAEYLSVVTPLTLEYWITNDRPTYNGVNTLTINAADEGVATRKGVTVNEVAPVTTERTKRELDRWQTRLLDVELENNSTSGTEMQTNASGDDETLNGTAFTKIRYWNGEWQVYTNDWQKVDRTMVTVDGETREKNQLVVYYMEKFNINNANGESELNVNVSDWGTKGDGSGDWGYNPEDSRCSVSVQIVYEDNSTNPVDTTAEKLKSKTILYGYWNQGRGLGTMLFTGQQNYEIYKVTAETGTMESTESGNYVTVTSFAWANNEKTVWEGEQQPSVSICNPTTNPSYESPYDNLAWNTSNYNKNNSILIRVYVKAKVNEASLTAHYIDMKSDAEFYAVNYNVKEGTVFDSGFGMNNGELVNNTVTNYNGIQQKVEADLKKCPR